MTEPLHPLLAGRKSPAVFDPNHVLGDAEIASLMEAARWSPSFGNSQPWSYVVLRRGSAGHSGFVRLLSRGNSEWAPQASALIVGVRQTGPEPELKTFDYTAYDLGQSAAHLTIQVEHLGLNAHQFAGFDHEGARALLQVPDNWAIMATIAVGRWWPVAERVVVDDGTVAREDRARHRKPLSEFVFAETFGHPDPATRSVG